MKMTILGFLFAIVTFSHHALRDQESRGANRKIELSDELKKVEDALKTMQGPVERNPSVAIQKRKKAPNDASSAGTTEINTAVCGAAK